MIEIIPNWHPIFVHFTVALLSLSVMLFVLTRFINGPMKDQLELVARWCLWFGAGFTILTGASGIYAYNTVDHDTPSHLAMTEHRNWAFITIVVFFALTAWSFFLVQKGKAFSGGFIVLSVVAGLLLSSTAWHGGEVVYRYGLGVMSLPKSSGEGHDHDHGDGGGHAHGATSSSHNNAGHMSIDDAGMDFSGMDMDDKPSDMSGGDAHPHDDGHAHEH